jgi:hypothetical protein
MKRFVICRLVLHQVLQFEGKALVYLWKLFIAGADE